MSESDGEEIRASEAAQCLGLTPQAIGQWVARPGAPARKDASGSWVVWPRFARWREEELVRQAVEKATAGSDYEEQRTRRMRAAASLAEIELAKAQGEAMLVADAILGVRQIFVTLAARLRALPVRFAHFGPDVERAAEDESERIIVELSKWSDDPLPDIEETEPTDTAG